MILLTSHGLLFLQRPSIILIYNYNFIFKKNIFLFFYFFIIYIPNFARPVQCVQANRATDGQSSINLKFLSFDQN